jgi:hypothetical protein
MFDTQTISPDIADHNLNAMLSAGAALSAQLQKLHGYSLERIKDLHQHKVPILNFVLCWQLRAAMPSQDDREALGTMTSTQCCHACHRGGARFRYDRQP